MPDDQYPDQDHDDTTSVEAGSTTSGHIVHSDERFVVHDGGTASSTTVLGGGLEIVREDGTDSGALISGGTQRDEGLANGATVSNGVTLLVSEKGKVTSTTVLSGAGKARVAADFEGAARVDLVTDRASVLPQLKRPPARHNGAACHPMVVHHLNAAGENRRGTLELLRHGRQTDTTFESGATFELGDRHEKLSGFTAADGVTLEASRAEL
jgi:autotransporter passenger strand-loop-strand repeat protein